MKDDESATVKMEQVKLEDVNDLSPAMVASPIDTTAAIKQEEARASLPPRDDEKIPVQAADAPQSAKSRYSRQPSTKVTARQPPLFDHYPNMTAEASMAFQVIPDCLYGSKNMGSTDNDAFDCDCREEWQDGENIACGEDSDCINRATKMECSAAAGNCGGGCQNQRFQRKQYADVSVIKTEKKGYGLRADMELHANDFIFEYIGEVINEPTFRRRMLQYDEEGIKHFYFMSLTKSEFVDATRKGNLGRFCNHSCNPNCFVDKWVVGDKLRMGIFALRTIRAGEELVFNYNVDRYGADPQPCYCGEPNCVGFIGGKTQTERATKLPTATIEALGIDFGDGWDTAVAKKPRKKKADEDDEEYVSSLQQKPLNGDDVKKVMASLLQCKEKWIAVKLLERIQRCHEEKIIHNVVRMHAYEILKTTLNNFGEDRNVDIQVLSILDSFPRLTRNKIQDSKIEVNVQMLASSEDREVAEKAQQLLESWSKLTVAYRIRRRKLDENAPQQNIYEDRRGQAREEETTQLQNKAPTQTIDAPKGPRSTVPQRHNNFYHGAPRPRRPNPNTPLPQGWFSAKDASNNTYYYDKSGTTTWQRPTQPAGSVSKTQSKAIQEQLAIQSIIDRVTKEGTPKQTTPQAMQLSDPPSKESKKDKWRTLPIDKQMKIYENTVFPPVKYVLDKFRHKLPKEELKRFGKDLAKKLVASDYKNNRVTDPTATLSDKQNKKIKVYVKDFLDRAVQKYDAQQKKSSTHASHKPVEQSQRPDKLAKSTPNSRTSPLDSPLERKDIGIVDDDITPHSGMEDDESEPRKRKREDNESEGADLTPSEGPDLKRVRDDDASQPSPPPPPPPPPAETAVEAGDIMEEEKALYEQEEALMRENEEAQRLEDEANQTKQMEDAVKAISRGGAATPVGGAADNDASNLEEHGQNRKHEVLSH